MTSAVHVQGRPVSYSTYSNDRCRCDGCRAANNAYHRKLRAGGGADIGGENRDPLDRRRRIRNWTAQTPEKAYLDHGVSTGSRESVRMPGDWMPLGHVDPDRLMPAGIGIQRDEWFLLDKRSS